LASALRHDACGMHASRSLRDHSTVKPLPTDNELPAKAGTLAPRNRCAMHVPTAVPA
jgi:hypothetical protein